MTIDPSWTIIAACSVVCLMAATLVGFSGFGFALIAVPLLSLIMDIKFAVPLVLLLAFFSVVVLSANKLRFFKEPALIITFGVIYAGMMLGIEMGTRALAGLDTAVLKRVLGIAVILFALHMFLRVRREEDAAPREGLARLLGILVAFVVGVCSGLGGGLFGTSGPPLVVYVDHFAENKSAFRAHLLMLFVLHDIFRLYRYIHHSLLSMEMVRFGLWLLPAVCVGLFVGSKLHALVSEKTFNRAVAAMLFVSGLLLLKP